MRLLTMDTQKTARPLDPGQLVGGKYQIIKKLATGGMAEIYLTRSQGVRGFEKYVVLKRILPQYAEDESFVQMFLNEAKVAATLDHPNIAGVHDFGEFEGGYFFTMEYLHGEDLRTVLRRTVNKGLAFPLKFMLTVGVGVAAGLHFAHEKEDSSGRPLGIVHRDVSPSNIVISYDGGVKLVDFGIAKATLQAEHTAVGMIKGKTGYMSPEQCSPQDLRSAGLRPADCGPQGLRPAGLRSAVCSPQDLRSTVCSPQDLQLDRRSDVFSLGVVLYEMATQRRLFKGDSELAAIKMILDESTPRPRDTIPSFPEELENIILKALDRNREKRYQTAREVEHALEEFAQKNAIMISTACLGEWMTSIFGGKKQEPWQTLTPVESEATESPTSVIEHPSEKKKTHLSRLLLWRSPPIGLFGKIALFVGLGAIALGSILAFAITRIPKNPQPAPTPSEVLIVETSGRVIATGPDAAFGTLPKEPIMNAASPAISKLVKNPKKQKKRGFSQIFSRHELEIERCLRDFPEDSLRDPQSDRRLSIRFQVSPNGKVKNAEVLPQEIGKTPLGTCLGKIASRTEFEIQEGPVAFSIPITVRRIIDSEKP
jgi:serine/threonine protein kinase